MEVTLKDRWDAMFGGLQFVDVWLNENEYVCFESWVNENGVRSVIVIRVNGYEVRNKETKKFVRKMTREEEDATFDFAEEQFEIEEELDNAYTEMEH